MRLPGRLLLLVVLLLSACGDGAGGGAVDEDAYATAAAAADLPEALTAGERIVTDLLAALEVEERPRDDVRPYRVSRCDEVDDEGPHVVSVARGIAFSPDTTDGVLEGARGQLEDAGVEAVEVVGADGVLPVVTGLFGGDRWQVAATLNREDGIGEIRVNSPCLPGELPEPPSSS